MFGGELQLNQNTQSACRLSKGNISNISGMAKNIRLKISGHIEGNYKLTKRDMSILPLKLLLLP